MRACDVPFPSQWKKIPSQTVSFSNGKIKWNHKVFLWADRYDSVADSIWLTQDNALKQDMNECSFTKRFSPKQKSKSSHHSEMMWLGASSLL
jgi:hypothetical protein